MAFDNTITEQDMDAATQLLVQDIPNDGADYEPDLAVDGMSPSIFSRLLSLIGAV